MNSLNILSARVSPPSTPAPSRSNSYGTALSLAGATDVRRSPREDAVDEKDEDEEVVEDDVTDSGFLDFEDEKTPLLEDRKPDIVSPKSDGWFYYPKWVATAFINSVRWVVSAIMAPGFYIVGCLYDETGRFAPFYQMGKFGRILWPSKKDGQSSRTKESAMLEGKSTRGSESSARRSGKSPKRSPVSTSSSSGLSSESESDHVISESDAKDSESGVRHTRSKSLRSSNEIAPARRSIRIKLHNEESLRQRKHGKSQSIASTQSNGSGAISVSSISPETLKSPTSPAAASLSMTKYPRAPAPPRPLIPRRLPSYTLADPINGKRALKTLVLDLDETLIHSMAKGGRMSTGHMVEVKLNTYIGGSGQQVPGPQHPILYYVHKRPHCDDFLRRVCKWYNLVIFTASVQEYADPVIDWLEQERKFFSGRLYRQHCTYRHGAFIKDLSSVEPDLSKVMILDNSPLSYMFHQDNAIPIEGWINDPTDNDLMHLVPLLEGLQHVTDVRALLALREGEEGKHMVM